MSWPRIRVPASFEALSHCDRSRLDVDADDVWYRAHNAYFAVKGVLAMSLVVSIQRRGPNPSMPSPIVRSMPVSRSFSGPENDLADPAASASNGRRQQGHGGFCHPRGFPESNKR